jgi:cysteine-rich repeat protein
MTTRVAWILVGAASIITACTYTLPTVDTSALCGNGLVDEVELCDDGNLMDGDECDSNCTPTGCGNLIVTANEECDDGNLDNDDQCNSQCGLSRCGDGFQQLSLAEQCDDGNPTDGDGCDTNCTATGCGNGVTSTGEGCDDGNLAWYDTCSPECKPLGGAATCGNGIAEDNEPCDDFNTNNGDTCNATCSLKGESSIFIGQPGVAGVQDGMGQAALVEGSHYMTLHGDKIYLANNETVRVIDIPTQEIKTIAGVDDMADFADAPNGADARFRDLRGITTDGTTLWVSDLGNHVIRSISIAPPHEVKTVAGIVQVAAPLELMDGPAYIAQLESPRGLVHLNGLVYFVEGNKAVLRYFDPENLIVATVAGASGALGTQDGTGTEARFYGPRHITTDGQNILYIADTYGRILRSYDVNTTYVKTIAGNATQCGYVDGTGTNVKLYEPRGLAFDGTSLYFAESSSHTIRQLRLSDMSVSTLSGIASECILACSCVNTEPAGSYAEGYAFTARWNNPYELAWHAASRSLFVSDGSNYVIRRIQ